MTIAPTPNGRLWWLLVLCLGCATSFANEADIEVSLSNDAPHYHLVYQRLRQRLLELAPDIGMHMVGEAVEKDISQKPASMPAGPDSPEGLRVTIGTSAYEAALKNDPTVPVFALFLPRRTYETLTEQYHPVKASTIYLDQPLERQLRLIKLLLPDAKTISVAVGSISRSQIPKLQKLVEKNSFDLKFTELSPQSNPIHALTPLMKNSDVFLAIPDRASMNRATAKWALQLGYRQQVPVIGFSKAYTDAGALAALYTTPENTADNAAELLSAWLADQDDAIWHPGYTRDFTISLNLSVARSLRLVLPETRQLYEQLHQLEEASQ